VVDRVPIVLAAAGLIEALESRGIDVPAGMSVAGAAPVL
jgi:hypothetical protein